MNEPARRPTPVALALAFLTVALASFGGGLSAWAQRVLVQQRGWLDDDEFLIRRRIHRDLAAVLREQGIG